VSEQQRADRQAVVESRRKREEDTTPNQPSQPNLPGDENISPPDNRETHLINPESRQRNARNPRRTIFDDMDVPMGEPVNALSESRSAESGGTKSGRRQIMPMYRAPRRYFLAEDVVVALPMKLMFSINKLDRSSPVTFKFILNDTYNIFRYTDLQAQPFDAGSNFTYVPEGYQNNPSTGSPPADNSIVPSLIQDMVSREKGISNDMAYDQWIIPTSGKLIQKPVNNNIFEARRFIRMMPTSVPGTTTATGSGKIGNGSGDVAPDYRDYYEKFYNVRHVHACNWKLTLENASVSDKANAVCMHKVETITPASGSLGQNLETNQSLHNAINWPHLDLVPIRGKQTEITGQWRNDSSSQHHDVIDEDEISIWYPTGIQNSPAPKLWEEFQTMMFYADDQDIHNPCYNVVFEAEWIVEYRDMKRLWRNRNRDVVDTTSLGTYNDLKPGFPGVTAGTNWPSVKNVGNFDSMGIARTIGNIDKIH
jgi:hypothetical protein